MSVRHRKIFALTLIACYSIACSLSHADDSFEREARLTEENAPLEAAKRAFLIQKERQAAGSAAAVAVYEQRQLPLNFVSHSGAGVMLPEDRAEILRVISTILNSAKYHYKYELMPASRQQRVLHLIEDRILSFTSSVPGGLLAPWEREAKLELLRQDLVFLFGVPVLQETDPVALDSELKNLTSLILQLYMESQPALSGYAPVQESIRKNLELRIQQHREVDSSFAFKCPLGDEQFAVTRRQLNDEFEALLGPIPLFTPEVERHLESITDQQRIEYLRKNQESIVSDSMTQLGGPLGWLGNQYAKVAVTTCFVDHVAILEKLIPEDERAALTESLEKSVHAEAARQRAWANALQAAFEQGR